MCRILKAITRRDQSGFVERLQKAPIMTRVHKGKGKKSLMDYSLKKVMKITALAKASILTLIYLGYHFLPFNVQNYQLNSIGSEPPVDFWATLKTWDAQHYLFLADHG